MISQAKKELNWEKMLSLCIDPHKARHYRQSLRPEDASVCSMCGEFCAIKRSNSIGP
jgi:phosphomethylpyrimidine synthase